MAKAKVYQDLHAEYPYYFIRQSIVGSFYEGICVKYRNGKWEVDFCYRVTSNDFKYDIKHHPVVGEIDLSGTISMLLLEMKMKNIIFEQEKETVKPYAKSFLDEDEEHGKFSSTYWMCPNCNTHIGVKYNNYCSFCGAKLDWSEEIAKLSADRQRRISVEKDGYKNEEET